MRRLSRSEVRSLLDTLRAPLEESYEPLRVLAGLLGPVTNDIDLGRVLDELFPSDESVAAERKLVRLQLHMRKCMGAVNVSFAMRLRGKRDAGRARRVSFHGMPWASVDPGLRALSDARDAVGGVALVQRSEAPVDGARVLVVTANENEHRAVREVLGQALSRSGEAPYASLPSLGKYQVFHLISEQGPVSSAIAVTDAARTLRPTLVVAVGMAFGARVDQQQLGDVLVATQVIDYDYERIGESAKLSRGARTDAPAEWLARVKDAQVSHARNADWPAIHFGPLLSGSKLIDNPNYRDELLAQNGGIAIGGEMEARGIVQACAAVRCHWLIIKGIADWAAAKPQHVEKQRVQYKAAHAAARVLRATLMPDETLAAASAEDFDRKKAEMPSPVLDALDNLGHRLIENRGRHVSLHPFNDDRDGVAPALVGRNAFDCLLEWALAQNPASRRCFMLLGEYGMGKTVLCQRLVRELEQRRKQGQDVPLPLYFDLRRLTNLPDRVPTREEVMRKCIERGWTAEIGQTKPSLDDIRTWQEQGALLIFDGLDETLVHLTEADGHAFVSQLMRIFPPQNDAEWVSKSDEATGRRFASGARRTARVLLSCRTHFFRSIHKQRAMLNGRTRGGVDDTQFESFLLLPFTGQQIEEYLTKTLPQSKASRALATLKDLKFQQEIASRPYFLWLIALHIGQIEKWRLHGQPVYGVTIYREFTRAWLARDSSRHYLKPEDKLSLARDLAAELWRRGGRIIEVGELERWFDGWLDARSGPGRSNLYHLDRGKLETDLRSSSFLVHEDVGSRSGFDARRSSYFRFAHTSLQEYFLAEFLLSAIRENAPDRWAMAKPSMETLDYLGQLLEEDGERHALVEQLSAWRKPYRRQVGELIVHYVCVASACGWPAPRLDGVDLRSAQLVNMIFVDSIGDSGLTSLIGADFTSADLRNAQIANWRLDRAAFVRTDLDLTEFVGCSFRGADFSGSSVIGTTFRQCDLRGSVWDDVDRSAMTCVSTFVDAHFEQGSDLPVLAPATSAGPIVDTAILAKLTPPAGSASRSWLTPDSRRVLIAGNNGGLWTVDAQTMKTVAETDAAAGLLLDCTFSSDGKRLITIDAEGSLRLHDGETLRFLAQQNRPADRVAACDFSSDRRLLVIAFRSGSVELRDAQTLMLIRSEARLVRDVLAVFFSRDDDRIGLIEVDESGCVVRYLEVPTLIVLTESVNLEMKPSLYRRSPARTTWAIADQRGNVQIRSYDTFDVVATLSVHEPLSSMAFSVDGDELALVTETNHIIPWNLVRGVEEEKKDNFNEGLCIPVSNGKYLSCVGAQAHLLFDRRSDVALLARLERIAPATTACAFSPNGAYVACGNESGNLVIWRRGDLEVVQVFSPHRSRVIACAISSDGELVVSGDEKGDVMFGSPRASSPPTWRLQIDDVPVAAAMSSSSQRILLVHRSGAATLRCAESGKVLATFRRETVFAKSAAFSQDDRFLFLNCLDGPRRWDDKTDKLSWPSALNRISVSCKFHGDQLVEANVTRRSPSYAQAFQSATALLDVHEPSSREFVPPHALSGAGDALVSCGADGMLRLWDLATTTCIAEMHCTNTAVASWSLAENRLICAYGDAWRKLGWLARDPNGVMRRWPLEIFGHECEPIPPHLQLS